ncbi:MAG: hypothetical protein JWR07_308 [Nevskia sp.]|nr:hypothetical protein [Nevskia sp.]
MSKEKPDAAEQVEAAHDPVEGGIFYPVGYIVVGVPDHQTALRLQQQLADSGLPPKDCAVQPAAVMARAAAQDLESRTVLSAIGSSGHVRSKQLELAREGCDFLIIKAATDAEKDRVMAQLSRVPVRYAVLYRRLVIENLIDHIPSATADREPARKA